MAIMHSHTPRFFKKRSAPEALSGVCICGIFAPAYKKAETSGTDIKARVRYCQLLCLNKSKNTVANRTTATTPHAYTECSLLISLSGSFAGMAAMTGLINTSPKPDATEKITVPMTSPR